MRMRPQTNKANMRDERRRQGNKRTHGVLRAEQRRKRSNKRRKRHEIRAATPNREVLTDRQLGESEGAVAIPKPKLIRPTTAELERDALKEENEKMKEYTQFLLWRLNEQERKSEQGMEILVKVHKGQARHIRRIEAKLRKAQDNAAFLLNHRISFFPGTPEPTAHRVPTAKDIKELAGVAC